LISWGAGSMIGYFLFPQILNLLLQPLQKPLFYTSPAGGLDFTLKISLFFGFLTALPVIMYHIFRFIQPAMPPRSLFFICQIFFFSLILMILGICFAYFISLPAALHFLSTFGNDQIQSLISADDYFSFVTRYILGFGILFELPLVLLLINSFYTLKIKTLFAWQKFVILASFIVAAVITPTPDFLNQTVMAVPLIALYEISILLIFLFNKRGKT
jgi:sec-independent protein translocase protein TatC